MSDLVSHGKAFDAYFQAKIMLSNFEEGNYEWKDDWEPLME